MVLRKNDSQNVLSSLKELLLSSPFRIFSNPSKLKELLLEQQLSILLLSFFFFSQLMISDKISSVELAVKSTSSTSYPPINQAISMQLHLLKMARSILLSTPFGFAIPKIPTRIERKEAMLANMENGQLGFWTCCKYDIAIVPAPQYRGTRLSSQMEVSKTKQSVISGILQSRNIFTLLTKKNRQILKVIRMRMIGWSLQKKAACSMLEIMKMQFSAISNSSPSQNRLTSGSPFLQSICAGSLQQYQIILCLAHLQEITMVRTMALKLKSFLMVAPIEVMWQSIQSPLSPSLPQTMLSPQILQVAQLERMGRTMMLTEVKTSTLFIKEMIFSVLVWLYSFSRRVDMMDQNTEFIICNATEVPQLINVVRMSAVINVGFRLIKILSLSSPKMIANEMDMIKQVTEKIQNLRKRDSGCSQFIHKISEGYGALQIFRTFFLNSTLRSFGVKQFLMRNCSCFISPIFQPPKNLNTDFRTFSLSNSIMQHVVDSFFRNSGSFRNLFLRSLNSSQLSRSFSLTFMYYS